MPFLSRSPHDRPGPELARAGTGIWRELIVFVVLVSFFYGALSLSMYLAAPVNRQAVIHLEPSFLPLYALMSLARLALAYVLSLVITLLYSYIAAHNARAEGILIPLLDILQSIPVLSFLPPVMIAMIALFPGSQLGLELGSILLIATGQIWNMSFSVYSSMKSLPVEMLEAAAVFRFSWWQKFVQVELPHAMIGLVWNSMMSVAGGWFFLMACEMFVLGNQDLRLPGLGSYLQTAASAGDTRAIAWGLFVMVAVIVLIDQAVWRPVIAWSEKFKVEQVEASLVPRSPVLVLLRHSRILSYFAGAVLAPTREAVNLYFVNTKVAARARPVRLLLKGAQGVLAAAGVVVVLLAATSLVVTMLKISSAELLTILRGAGASFMRVELVLILAALWTIPVGVEIGLRPRLASFAQPLAQIAASVPATALFPLVLMALIKAGGGLGIASMVLLLLGTQWYMLFNIIAGASAIPTDLREVCDVFRLGRRERWRKLLLPGIFPYLITGFVTASGGAWNASIVAEYVHFRGQTISTIGLGSVISEATDTGNVPVLVAATVVMSLIVVTINKLLWRPLFRLASGRFSMNA